MSLVHSEQGSSKAGDSESAANGDSRQQHRVLDSDRAALIDRKPPPRTERLAKLGHPIGLSAVFVAVARNEKKRQRQNGSATVGTFVRRHKTEAKIRPSQSEPQAKTARDSSVGSDRAARSRASSNANSSCARGAVLALTPHDGPKIVET
jgi:hypothetical protein